MKRALSLSTTAVVLCSILFICCSKTDQQVQVNKKVDEFYRYFNQRNFAKMKAISTPRVATLIDFFEMIGQDLMQIDSTQIISTDVTNDHAKVQVRVWDTYGKMFYHEILLQKNRQWIITNVDGFMPSASPNKSTQTNTNQ
jgi:hypothetical protein